MRHSYLFFFVAATILFSCKKENQPIDPPSPPLPPPPTVLIKDIVLSHLPSPYYHFEYNPAGKVTFVSFASDFTRYDVVYDGDRIREMLPGIQLQKNNPGKETRTGDGDHFKVDYTYTYNDRMAPLTRSGDFVYTSGPNTGQRAQLSSVYTYYPE